MRYVNSWSSSVKHRKMTLSVSLYYLPVANYESVLCLVRSWKISQMDIWLEIWKRKTDIGRKIWWRGKTQEFYLREIVIMNWWMRWMICLDVQAEAEHRLLLLRIWFGTSLLNEAWTWWNMILEDDCMKDSIWENFYYGDSFECIEYVFYDKIRNGGVLMDWVSTVKGIDSWLKLDSWCSLGNYID